MNIRIDIRLLLDECIFLPYNIQEYGIIRLIVDDYLECGLPVVTSPFLYILERDKMKQGLGYLHDTIQSVNNGLNGACEGNYCELVELMISKGANDWNGGLHAACLGGHIKLAELMISKGADNWNWGLYGACYGGHLKLVQLMVFKGISKSDICRCLSTRYTSSIDIIKYLESRLEYVYK